LVLGLIACAKGGDSTTDSSAGTPAALVSQAPQARSAELTKPIDQYTGAEFQALVRGLTFVGGVERERSCRGCTGARANVRTRVRVDGVEGVDSVGAAVPQYGVVVARAMNRGGDPENRYGMRPGARYEYYLIVLPGTTPTWRIEELDVAGANVARRQLATGRVQACNHPFARGARSDFRTCEEAQARPATLLLQAGGNDSPWWYACAAGCCVAEDGGEA
jgi:hypothetical protein